MSDAVASPERFFVDGGVYEAVVDDQWLTPDANAQPPRLWLELSVKPTGRLNNQWDLSHGMLVCGPEFSSTYLRPRVDVLPNMTDSWQKTLETLCSYGFSGTDTTRLSLDHEQPLDLRGQKVYIKCVKKPGKKEGQVFTNWYLQKNMQQAARPRTSLDQLKAFAAQYGQAFPSPEGDPGY